MIILNILSSACASIYNILDPEVLALGGGLSAAGPFLFDPLQDKVSKNAFYSTRGKLVPAVLGNEAGMIGAALLARDAEAIMAHIGFCHFLIIKGAINIW